MLSAPNTQTLVLLRKPSRKQRLERHACLLVTALKRFPRLTEWPDVRFTQRTLSKFQDEVLRKIAYQHRRKFECTARSVITARPRCGHGDWTHGQLGSGENLIVELDASKKRKTHQSLYAFDLARPSKAAGFFSSMWNVFSIFPKSWLRSQRRSTLRSFAALSWKHTGLGWRVGTWGSLEQHMRADGPSSNEKKWRRHAKKMTERKKASRELQLQVWQAALRLPKRRSRRTPHGRPTAADIDRLRAIRPVSTSSSRVLHCTRRCTFAHRRLGWAAARVPVAIALLNACISCSCRLTEQNERQRRRERERESPIWVKRKDNFKPRVLHFRSFLYEWSLLSTWVWDWQKFKTFLRLSPQTVKFKTFIRSGKSFWKFKTFSRL